MNIFQRLWRWLFSKKPKPRHVRFIDGDTPPSVIEGRDLVVAREDGEDWAVAFLCPCGCGDRLELALIPEACPNWKLSVSSNNLPTLHPSVWRKNGCRSHFWLREGLVVWCKEELQPEMR